MIAKLPNWLTWARVVAIPLLVILYVLPMRSELRDALATALFMVAAATDWLDGWLARKLGVTTAFGAFLDPVADKLIVAAALVMLLTLGRVEAWVAFVIIGREITISALREWMTARPTQKRCRPLGRKTQNRCTACIDTDVTLGKALVWC